MFPILMSEDRFKLKTFGYRYIMPAPVGVDNVFIYLGEQQLTADSHLVYYMNRAVTVFWSDLWNYFSVVSSIDAGS